MIELNARIAALRRAQSTLAARPRDDVVRVLGGVVDTWLAPDSAWFTRALEVLPDATGFSPAMIRHALPTMLEPLRSPALADLLAREVGARRGPALILHVLPGNLPGLAAIPTALSLAVGSAALLKAGRGDRVFPSLFAASIAERDPELGACGAAVYWPGGDRDREDMALAAADLVVASGDDATIADLARRVRGRFIGHGHRISFAFVAREVADDPSAALHAAERLAEDVAIWDQRGCLSPQLCFVEGSVDAALRFGSLAAEALRPLALSLAPAHPTAADRLALRRFREDAEWRRFGGERAAVFASERDEYGTVVIEPKASFRPTPLNRSLRVQPVADADALASVLAPARAALESAGIAAAPGRWTVLAERMMACGVHRVSELGDMQRPPLAWRQGGRPRVGDWTIGAPR
jgi:Acyl-CoA reductase (LuxC)